VLEREAKRGNALAGLRGFTNLEDGATSLRQERALKAPLAVVISMALSLAQPGGTNLACLWKVLQSDIAVGRTTASLLTLEA
jgi:hypothetical protein